MSSFACAFTSPALVWSTSLSFVKKAPALRMNESRERVRPGVDANHVRKFLNASALCLGSLTPLRAPTL